MPKTSQMIRIKGKGFQAFEPEDFEKVRYGEVITITWTKARNPRFHRKAFALFKYVHDQMPEVSIEPIEYQGNTIYPRGNFDQTRKWMTIQAGYYDAFWVGTAAKGKLVIEAKSLAFGSMDEEEFEALYSSLIDVALEMLPHIVDARAMDDAVETVLRFDGGGRG